ncbi:MULTISPECIES: HEPN/Toprim-associated domain-containing protein [Alphaproteobacteria]|uniref:HEPN/Toprim N-terminal domain-containing protein n=1 Tax=Pseudoroseomonas ludipueritiae TaxID=198093 RepID=A0ABR7R4T8_9PROT|nr:HEPN/Toprim-associated domain-containing protein [Pseudoroseomonas ludipueritiae]MBC9176738.1 hypothetical protein [Pseudoroseomonas ludipueritiae]
MGTSIELKVSGVSLDYAKNNSGNDYGHLFQESDLARRPSDGIDYDYYRDHPEQIDDLAESELAFVRPLARVIPRLRVLGDTLDGARAEYEAVVADALSSLSTDEEPAQFLDFDEFCALASLFPLASLADEYIDYDTEERASVAQGRFAPHAALFARIPWTENSDSYWSEASFLSAKLCILSPSSMLQIFFLNPDNADAEVIWQFGNIVHAGWVDRSFFAAGVQRNQSILVATEGASDARILRRALDLLRPDVADFFRFINGEERHHFWGTGNLVRFAEGLVRIDIQNQVLFLLDNDAEGIEAYGKLQELKMPGNLRSMVLPDSEDLRRFPALGPEGLNECDINGRAAAIECYLDLNLPSYPPARVIWSNYKRDIDAWHGALEHKESYDRHFMKQDADSLTSGSYDTSKLTQVLDALIAEVSHFGGRAD